MDVENVFHMTGGVGVTSYAKNSSLQVYLSFLLDFLYSVIHRTDPNYYAENI